MSNANRILKRNPRLINQWEIVLDWISENNRLPNRNCSEKSEVYVAGILYCDWTFYPKLFEQASKLLK